MKKITYELIDSLEKTGPGQEAEILKEKAEAAGPEGQADGSWFFALSPDRINILESLPWDKDMEVLQLGAQYGVFAPLCSKVRRWDILDPAAEELELVRRRYPALAAEGGISSGQDNGQGAVTGEDGASKLCLLSEPRRGELYDAVILFLPGNASALEGLSEQLGLDTRTEQNGARIPVLTKAACAYLKPEGMLVLAADNAEALCFAAGEKPDPSEYSLDRETFDRLVQELPFRHRKIYYPLPGAAFARNIYSDGRLPEGGDFKDVSENFLTERYALYNEEAMYAAIAGAGAFHAFAPSWLAVLYGNNEAAAFPDYIRYNRRRAPQYALKTEIFTRNEAGQEPVRWVRKTALSKEGNAHIEALRTGTGCSFRKCRQRLNCSPSPSERRRTGWPLRNFPLWRAWSWDSSCQKRLSAAVRRKNGSGSWRIFLQAGGKGPATIRTCCLKI